MDEPGLPERTRLGPPGVDVHRFGPATPRAPARGSRASSGAWRRRTRPPAARLRRVRHGPRGGGRGAGGPAPGRAPIVAYVGKLIVSKGVDLLLAAWPLVLGAVPGARLVVVGFGAYRDGPGAPGGALGGRRPGRRARTGGGRARARRADPRASCAIWPPSSTAWRAATRTTSRPRALSGARWTSPGASSTTTSPTCCPPCEAQVVPSTFPEAFGMVAAEAAACGALPVSAAHSGLAEVTAALAAAVPAEAARLLSFPLSDRAVEELAERLVAWLEAPPDAARGHPRGPGGASPASATPGRASPAG